jgi:hypothetical protein
MVKGMPELLPSGVLHCARIAIPVSESADLNRLGLLEIHFRLALAEIARCVLVSGGTLVYGGHLRRDGYTNFLVQELQKSSGQSAADMPGMAGAPRARALGPERASERARFAWAYRLPRSRWPGDGSGARPRRSCTIDRRGGVAPAGTDSHAPLHGKRARRAASFSVASGVASKEIFKD